MAFGFEVAVGVGMDQGEFLQSLVCQNLSVARSRRRNASRLLSTELLVRRPIFCLQALPSSFITDL